MNEEAKKAVELIQELDEKIEKLRDMREIVAATLKMMGHTQPQSGGGSKDEVMATMYDAYDLATDMILTTTFKASNATAVIVPMAEGKVKRNEADETISYQVCLMLQASTDSYLKNPAFANHRVTVLQ
jgi:hypothetical protein